MIAQRPQRHRQIARPLFRRGVVLTFTVTVNHSDQAVSGGALRVEIVEGLARRCGIGGIGHEEIQSDGQGILSEQGSILLGFCSLFL